MFSKKLSADRGIVLVTVLLLTMLIAMFIGGAILVGPRTLGLAGSQDGELMASAAAESGMQYALMRIRENPEWRGDGSGLVLSTPDFSVVEDSGYVWGHLKSPTGKASMFRIRFNYENGPGNGEQLDDSQGPRIPIPYVSVNNLSSSKETVVPRATDDSQSTVLDPTVGDYSAPSHAICLLVEGLSGSGLDTFDPSDPNPKGLTQSKVLETVFVASNVGDIANDAAAMSNSDLIAVLQDNKEFKVEAKGDGSPQIRSRGVVNIAQQNGSAAKYNSEGKVFTKDATLAADYDPAKVKVEPEDSTNPFYELTWDDLATADPKGDRIPAGTYVWWDDDSLHYYDQDYAEYAQWIKNPLNTNNPGKVVFSGGSYGAGFTPPDSLNISKGKIQITGDLYVEPVTGSQGSQASDLAIIPREGAAEEPPSSSGGGRGSGGVGVMGPAVAEHLASNPPALQAFFTGRAGDGSAIGTMVSGGQQGWNSASGSGPGADISWNASGQVFYDPGDYPSLQAALKDAFAGGFVPVSELEATASLYNIIENTGELNLNTGDTTSAQDIKIEFKPANGESATLSAEGNIQIGAKVEGDGASITSGGTLKIIGAGADLAATPNAEEGVNMYAKGDITLSTLKKKKNGDYQFQDIKLKGLVYTWGDFQAKLGSDDPNAKWGKMRLEGTLVAFGGDPAQGIPGNSDKGKIQITAKDVKLDFDPAYLLGVRKTLPDNIQFDRTTWTAYR